MQNTLQAPPAASALRQRTLLCSLSEDVNLQIGLKGFKAFLPLAINFERCADAL